MKTVPIALLTDKVATWNPAKSPEKMFKYVDLTSVDNELKTITGPTTVIGAEAPSRARQLISAGDILVSTVRPNLNAVAVVPDELDGATASTGFTVLRPDEQLDPRYLFHWVRSPWFVGDMVRKATGASYPAVSDRIVKESLIPAPSVDEQRRIAAILDQADALRAKRRQVLAHLDALSQSIFHDMFDSVTESIPLVDFVTEFRYGTSNKSGNSGYPTLRIPNVIGGAINLQEVKTVEVTRPELHRLQLVAGDVLFVRSNGNPDNVGRCAVFDPKSPTVSAASRDPWIYASYLIRARLSDTVEPGFVAASVASRTGRSQLRDQSKTSAGQYNINIEGLSQIQIPNAPLLDQREFVVKTRWVIAQRTVVAQGLMKLDALFASLQARAFRGDL